MLNRLGQPPSRQAGEIAQESYFSCHKIFIVVLGAIFTCGSALIPLGRAEGCPAGDEVDIPLLKREADAGTRRFMTTIEKFPMAQLIEPAVWGWDGTPCQFEPAMC